MLDAACHSLITRNMFSDSYYYGLDVSPSASLAFQNKFVEDTLYRADLCRQLPLDSMFDVVVSCNTMSHLLFDQQMMALNNLISCCALGGDLIINYTLSEDIMFSVEKLLLDFSSVESIYFDSYLSNRDEVNGQVSVENIDQKILSNEINVPNSALFHRQVLFHARNRLSGSLNVGKAPKSSHKVLILSELPDVQSITSANDSLALESFP